MFHLFCPIAICVCSTLVQDLFKTSKTECTKACRSWLTRHAMFGAISKLRKQIDAEIKALNELLGNGIVAAAVTCVGWLEIYLLLCWRGYVANSSVNMGRASVAKLVLSI
jgi:hypothetical protein